MTHFLRSRMSALAAPAFPIPTVGKLWGSRDPLGAVLNGLERHFRVAPRTPRRRGNCPHMVSFPAMKRRGGHSNPRRTERPEPVFETALNAPKPIDPGLRGSGAGGGGKGKNQPPQLPWMLVGEAGCGRLCAGGWRARREQSRADGRDRRFCSGCESALSTLSGFIERGNRAVGLDPPDKSLVLAIVFCPWLMGPCPIRRW